MRALESDQVHAEDHKIGCERVEFGGSEATKQRGQTDSWDVLQLGTPNSGDQGDGVSDGLGDDPRFRSGC